MKKQWGYQAIALSTIVMALASCRDGGRCSSQMVAASDSCGAQVRDDSMRSDQKMNMMADRIDDLQKQICCIAMETVHGTWGGKVPAHYETDSFFITAEFLYWKADEDGLEYAVETNAPFTSGSPGPVFLSTIGTPQADIDDLDFEWNPGFRVGIGGEMGGHDHWDLYLNYTHIKNKAHGRTKQDATAGVITPLWFTLGLGAFTQDAHAKWHVDFNTLDLELGKDYFVGKDLTIRPHFGLRGASIDQKYHADYDVIPIAGITFTNRFKASNKYTSVGLRAGSDMMWHFGKNFGIYGEISGALVYGKFKVRETTDAQLFGTGSGSGSGPGLVEGTSSWKEHFWRTRTNIQGAIGLEWEEIFGCDNDYRIAISIGYEMSEWFNQNQLFDVSSTTVPTGGSGTAIFVERPEHVGGDLGFQGGTLRVTLDF